MRVVPANSSLNDITLNHASVFRMSKIISVVFTPRHYECEFSLHNVGQYTLSSFSPRLSPNLASIQVEAGGGEAGGEGVKWDLEVFEFLVRWKTQR